MKPTVLVLGSGPIRIGQGIEFDYSCVHCVWALQEIGYRAILLNNNPETVSTDFDTGDGLYFEPVTLSDVTSVYEHEGAIGVVCQFGGQTAINLAEPLHQAGIPVLGTDCHSIAMAEDRQLFDELLTELGVPKPPGRAVTSIEEALSVAEEVGLPVLVRPSFVLGGRAMEICHTMDQLRGFFQLAQEANPEAPVLVDKYLLGVEAEVDVISDGTDTLVPGIMEHIERAGVHSGDSMAVYPPQTLSREVQRRMVDVACALSKSLGIRGVMNIQFVVMDEIVYVIEVNPRASRTVPYLSKVSGIPMVQLATRTMMGQKLADLGYSSGLWCADPSASIPAYWVVEEAKAFAPRVGGRVVPADEYGRSSISQSHLVAVKAPVFSFQKLTRVEPSLGPEMKSTGEILGIDFEFSAALYKAMVASHITFRSASLVALTLNDSDKHFAAELGKRLVDAGYGLVATGGTHEALSKAGIVSEKVNKIQDGAPTLIDYIREGKLALMIDTPSPGGTSTDEARKLRRACIEAGIACVTNIDTAKALSQALPYFDSPHLTQCRPYTDYLRNLK